MLKVFINKPEEVKGIFGTLTNDYTDADIILVVIPSNPSIEDTISILEWAYTDTYTLDAHIFFAFTENANPALCRAVQRLVRVRELVECVNYININYINNDIVSLLYTITETLRARDIDVPELNDLCDTVANALNEHSPWTISVCLNDFLSKDHKIDVNEFNKYVRSQLNINTELSDTVWRNTGSAYLSTVFMYGVNTQPSEELDKYTMLRLFQPYDADSRTALYSVPSELLKLEGY